MQSYLKKQNKTNKNNQRDNLTLHLKQLEKEKQTNKKKKSKQTNKNKQKEKSHKDQSRNKWKRNERSNNKD